MRDVQATISRLGQFQIDSINVVTRAHFMPLFSRLGSYDPGLLERAAHRPPRRLFEYWGHAASLIDVDLQPLLRFRMQDGFRDVWPGIERVARENADLVTYVRDEVAGAWPDQRPRDRDRGGARPQLLGLELVRVKTCLEWLFYCGEITSAFRNTQFERVYDLTERVMPAKVLAATDAGPAESVAGLVRSPAAQALGVASEFCLRDYFRTRPAMTRQAIAGAGRDRRAAAGDRPGLGEQAALRLAQARWPRRIEARALLSPFDSMIFERSRLEQLFDFAYRIEIYVPGPKRVYGYYVYPFLLGEHFVARVDLKADRARGVLRVNSAWLEPGHDRAASGRLAAELVTMAGWPGLSASRSCRAATRRPTGAGLRRRPTMGVASGAPSWRVVRGHRSRQDRVRAGADYD